MTTNCGCFACVQESDVAIVEHCGEFRGVATPGCQCLCCCLGDCIAGVVSSRVQQLDVSAETKTKDNVFVTLRINVQYQAVAEKENQAFYALENHVQQIRAYVYDVVRAAVPRIELDKVFEQKEDIAIAVKNELCKSMEDYGWHILQVLIADIVPDAKVKHAMNEINAAQRLRVATVDKAEAEKVLVVKRAEADAESKYLGGVGIARQRKAISDGLRDSVISFTEGVHDANPRDVMDLVLVTQYFDTIKELGERAHAATIFLPGGSSSSGGQTTADMLRSGMLEAHAGMYAQAQAQQAANTEHRQQEIQHQQQQQQQQYQQQQYMQQYHR